MEINTVIISVVVAVASIGTAYGVLRSIVNRNASDINKLVPQTECDLKHAGVTESLTELKISVKEQQKITGQFKNFALYQLMVKDKMSLPDATDVLENGGS